MSYATPDRKSYNFGAIDFGAATTNLEINGPAGKSGRVRAIHVASTETFTNTTTEGRVDVGSAGDADAYATMGLGVLAAGDALESSNVTGAIKDVLIPKDTAVKVALVAPTGGTPAGIGFVTIDVDWFVA